MNKWLFCICLLGFLTGCDRGVEPIHLSGATMGTTWRVSYIEPPQAPGSNVIRSEIEALLEDVNEEMSTYRDESRISRFNRQAPGTWFPVSPAFQQVLTAALLVGAQSEGAYDVTVAPLVDLWGFGPAGEIAAVPSQEKIGALLESVGQQHLQLDTAGGQVRKDAGVSLDFSSLAKGFAVDRIAELLLSSGINRFMVEVGGELRLSGLSARNDPWRIAIERPDSVGRSAATAISLTDVAVATSGDYRNYFELEGRRYSHMIDPRSGYPVAHDLVSVTVVHPGCMLADAWATALAVLGAERAMAVALEQELAVYFIRRVGDTFVHSHTPAFEAYLDAEHTLSQKGEL